MNWASWGDFAAMGGHGLYVWGSYAVTAGLIVVEILLLRARGRAALSNIDRRSERNTA